MNLQALVREMTARLVSAGISATESLVEARILVRFALDLTPEKLRMSPERELLTAELAAVNRLVERRMRREPLAYIVGTREFFGLQFHVTPDVLIPRPETEFLVEVVLEFLGQKPNGRVVDVGTGSGCIAIAVASREPHAEIFATDISANALAVARINAAANGVANKIRFAYGNLLAAVADAGPFDAIVSNPPYISPSVFESLQPEVREWEPRIALGLDEDDLNFYRRFAADAPAMLTDRGILAVEAGFGQADAVQALWAEAELVEVQAIPDYAGIPRVVVGRKA